MTADLRVAFKTLGCKVNRVESEDIAAELVGRGVLVVPEDQAQVIVVNTCTVTGEADAKARKAVRQALKSAEHPVVVVTGCLAALDADALTALGDRVVVEADKERVAERVAEVLGVPDEAPHAHAVRAGEGYRTRALLKIEDGCDVFCSYCIVPHARGVPRSVPFESVVAEARELVGAGAAEIVLTGINIGRYRDGDARLADVVEAVAAAGALRVRLSSIEPVDLTERLLSSLASTGPAVHHLHVPLQSGSDTVLARMRRAYTSAEYAAIVERARAVLPDLTLTTDVMAGFPAETDDEAAETRVFCERMGFSKLHVFRYSARPGTPAAEMSDQVEPRIRAERAAALRELGTRMREDFIASRIETAAEVLVEQVGDDGVAEGTTPDYVRVRFPSTSAVVVGQPVVVRLEGLLGDTVLGSLQG